MSQRVNKKALPVFPQIREDMLDRLSEKAAVLSRAQQATNASGQDVRRAV